MRKGLLLGMMVLALVALPSGASAQDADKKFEVTGDLRVRFDRLDNYFDLDDDSDDLFSFWPYRAVVGVNGMLADDVSVVMQIQNIGSWGNQSPVQGLTFPPFQDFDGDGSAGGERRGETSLYQAKLTLDKIGGTNIGATLGRQEYGFGTGLIIGNEPFYAGTVFDGAKGFWSNEDWSIDAFYYNVTERNDPANTGALIFSSDDANMYGAHGEYRLQGGTPSTIEGYVIRFADGDEASFRPDFLTIGGHWWRSVKTKADAEAFGLDWNAEIAFQSGNAHDPVTDERLDLRSGFIFDGSLGWNFVGGDAIHRVYGGYIHQSGDDDVTDTDIEGWIPLFPTVHNRFGNADFFDSNFAQNEASIAALSIGYDLDFNEGEHMFGVRLWKFMPVEDSVLFVPGGTKEEIDDYGTEIDLAYHYRYSKHVILGAGIAVLSPDEGVAGPDPNPDDTVTRAWGQAAVHF